jgi:uncharacterized protein (TIGR03067 family)
MYACIKTSLALVFALLVVAPPGGGQSKPKDGKAKAIREEMKRLQGTWERTFVGRNGHKFEPPNLSGKDRGPILMTIRSDGAHMPQGAEKGAPVGWYRIDPTARPKTFDYVIRTDEGAEQVLNVGIYEIEGDKLHMCYSTSGNPRPIDFTFKSRSHHIYNLLQRVKEKK